MVKLTKLGAESFCIRNEDIINNHFITRDHPASSSFSNYLMAFNLLKEAMNEHIFNVLRITGEDFIKTASETKIIINVNIQLLAG